jgi:hypothetical protein
MPILPFSDSPHTLFPLRPFTSFPLNLFRLTAHRVQLTAHCLPPTNPTPSVSVARPGPAVLRPKLSHRLWLHPPGRRTPRAGPPCVSWQAVLRSSYYLRKRATQPPCPRLRDLALAPAGLRCVPCAAHPSAAARPYGSGTRHGARRTGTRKLRTGIATRRLAFRKGGTPGGSR